MQNRCKTALIIALVLFIKTLSYAQDKYAAIDSLIHRSNHLGLFNGNVLIIDGGKEIYRKAIGYTDAAKRTQLTDEYRFHIGSIAKEFNACAIMMLKEQGKLVLDNPVIKYLPNLPAWAQKVTIKNLLQYTSGVPDLKWKFITNDKAAMDSLMNTSKLDFEPGTNYAYNNSNTFLQRQIVEKITGMRFADFVKQKMLRPLNMNASVVDPDDNTPSMAKSYNNSGVASPLVSPISGWTAVTLDDFYKWERNLEHFSLISAASTKELLTPFAPHKQCGLGGGEMNGNSLDTHVHDGTALNYQALIMADIKLGRTVILMTNNRQNSLYDIAGAIQNILDGKPYLQSKKQLITALQDKLETATGTQLIDLYRELKTKYPDDYNFTTEDALSTVAYTLMAKKRPDEAIMIFKYNTILFPKSADVFDDLAEAYLNKGDKPNALLNYKHALELNPADSSAKEKIILLQRP